MTLNDKFPFFERKDGKVLYRLIKMENDIMSLLNIGSEGKLYSALEVWTLYEVGVQNHPQIKMVSLNYIKLKYIKV